MVEREGELDGHWDAARPLARVDYARLMSPAEIRASMKQEAERIKLMREFVARHLEKDRDFGTIPGTQRPTLYKAGAERLQGLLHLDPDFVVVRETMDRTATKTWKRPIKVWDPQKGRKVETGEFDEGTAVGRYEVVVKCVLRHIESGLEVGSGIGSCNSWESKYLTVDVDSCANTILKMAKKRSHVDGVLGVGRLSSDFTQDVEDMDRPAAGAAAEREAPAPAGPTDGEAPTMSFEEAAAYVLPIGKFKGKALGALKDDQETIDYLGWMMATQGAKAVDKGNKPGLRKAAAKGAAAIQAFLRGRDQARDARVPPEAADPFGPEREPGQDDDPPAPADADAPGALFPKGPLPGTD